jgi:hypothetical protein
MVGLGSVDNTSDLNKPVSTAAQSALDGKQPAGSYLTSETDPVFLASQANYITASHIIILGNTSGTNTGDETSSTIKAKLGVTTLSGSNTGDQDLSSKQDVLVSGSNLKTLNGESLLGSTDIIVVNHQLNQLIGVI